MRMDVGFMEIHLQGASTEIEVVIYDDEKHIHLLDLMGNKNLRSLTNAIDREFQELFMDTLEIEGDASEYRWFLYGTDGVVSEYIRDNFFLPVTNRVDLKLYNQMIEMYGQS